MQPDSITNIFADRSFIRSLLALTSVCWCFLLWFCNPASCFMNGIVLLDSGKRADGRCSYIQMVGVEDSIVKHFACQQESNSKSSPELEADSRFEVYMFICDLKLI
ncbi:hypothetical protein H5410_006871 [Solanum commersonii]|uniref:Uncharacterized protein n=1 Tax=Solanum commersonii TaxID=4109 RepID=A0A9J6AAJ0_SOLCO|nr:hypothetical protein H5410_006871 [Solanum commersonii]